MTRAESLLSLIVEERTEKQQKNDARDARQLNRAFGAQFGMAGAAGIHKAHRQLKDAGVYRDVGNAIKKKYGGG